MSNSKRDLTLEQAIAEVSAGDLARAFAASISALAAGLEHPLFYKFRAAHHEREGRLNDAIADLRIALKSCSTDPGTLNALGLCLSKAGRLQEATTLLDRCIEIAPHFASAYFNLGWTMENAGDLKAADEAYGLAVAHDPFHAQAMANRAMLQARQANWSFAQAHGEAALTLDPELPGAIIAVALAELGSGKAEASKQRLKVLLKVSKRISVHERCVAEGVLGDANDSLGCTHEAFAAWQACNDGLRRLYEVRFQRSEGAAAFAHRLKAEFDALTLDSWGIKVSQDARASDDVPKRHIFLLGFPRSGTTLTGQILAAHPEIVTLDERETLADAAQAFLATPQGLKRFATLDEIELDKWRELYWRRVRLSGGYLSQKIFIDKLPTNTLGLPLIKRLFPHARIIFMQRDPRDVVLSCFRQRFVLSSLTLEMLNLSETANVFIAVMALFMSYRSTLNLDLRIQSYEALIADFGKEVRGLCEFVGAPFDPGIADFARRADEAIATPSAAQIRRGLYTNGAGQWRRYVNEMQCVLPALEPWIQQFGYGVQREVGLV